MGKALYRKYRSKSLEEVVGQPHITDALQSALKKGTISHAYLFTGPRGVGKTSVARILAHQINDLPYEGDEVNHLDIIEIDAASNRRIDEVRELKAKVHVAPTQAKYKVYIIDEVHMLTKEAFNALLKTLEEPPNHVVFILATTEMHKLPETIVSRTQRFGFKPISDEAVKQHLRHIAKLEHIDIVDDALELIAQHGAGSFRDSISLLDQVQHTAVQVERSHVEAMLGLAASQTVAAVIQATLSGDVRGLHQLLAQTQANGIQAGQLAKQIAAAIRNHLLEGTAEQPSELVRLLEKLAYVQSHIEPFVALELTLFEHALEHSSSAPELPSEPTVPAVKPKPAPDPEPLPQKTAPSPKKTQQQPEPPVETTSTTTQPSDAGLNNETWPNVLDALRSKHATLYGIIRMATPQFKPGRLILEFEFPFHQKRLKETKNQQNLINIIKSSTGSRVSVTAVVVTSSGHSEDDKRPVKDDSADVTTISNIFGGAEVVES